MKVLIVGCGAVGQVYGLALQKAGVELGLHDLPAATEKLIQARGQGGLALYQISFAQRKTPVLHRLKDYQVLTDTEACQQFAPDQIWFTTPSPVYYSDWFRSFLQQVPSERVVCFTPEGDRPEFSNEGIGDRIVFGGTTFMAWQSALEGDARRPAGVSFWRSPLGIPIVGSQAACREVGQVLKRAGFRVSVGKPDSHSQGSMTAVMTSFVAGLELAGWSLSGYRNSPWLKSAAAACGEAVVGQLSRVGAITRAILNGPILTACFFLATFLLPALFPFELEKYLKFHYTKTGEQTVFLLKIYITDCKSHQVPVTNLQNLLRGLAETRQERFRQ